MDTDMDMLTKILDHGHDYSEGFDSAEFVLLTTANGFQQSQGASSVYGVLGETHLTSTHTFHIPLPGITLGNVQEKP